jgi:hypothetical protein
LLAARDILSDSLGGTLHGFGGHFQSGQKLHLLTAMIKGCLVPYQSLHAAHSRRKFCMLDIQLDIGGELASVAMGAQIIGPEYLHYPHGR